MKALLLGVGLALALPAAASAVTLTFDDMVAPATFAKAKPLTKQYTADGVLFSGTGAVLNSVADFGVTGGSPPNAVGYAGGALFNFDYGSSATSDTVSFTAPQYGVSFDVGSGSSPLPLDIKTYDAVGNFLADQVVTLTPAYQLVTLDGGFSSFALDLVGSRSSDAFALDNLTFTAGPSALPTPEPAALGLLAIATGGVLGLRRRVR